MSDNMKEDRIGEDDLSNTDDKITGIPISHLKWQDPNAAFMYIHDKHCR